MGAREAGKHAGIGERGADAGKEFAVDLPATVDRDLFVWVEPPDQVAAEVGVVENATRGRS